MTQKRRDKFGTEYGDWTRDQPELDSSLGYIATNIDWLWMNYKTGLWMLKEEKRHRWFPKKYQVKMYRLLDRWCRADGKYRGFHIIIFERTSPLDGWIYLDGRYIESKELISFLRFELPDRFYMSWFPPSGAVRLGTRS